MESPAGHVVIIPTPGLGHLIPLLELAKRLVVRHHFSVTFFIPNDGNNLTPQKNVLHGQPSTISSTFLPPINFEDLPPDAIMETKIALTLSRSMPSIRDAVKTLAEKTKLVALVVDLFGLEAFEVANEFNILPYLFFPTNAMLLWLIFELPKLDESTTCEYRDLPEPVRLPGCVPLHGRDFPEPVQDRNDMAYKALVGISKRYRSAAGIMVNSFVDLEPGAFKAFKEQGLGLNVPPVFPVGPVIKTGDPEAESGENECLRWLNAQPLRSVLYVSFGSGGTLTSEQMNELALGLEMCKLRFLWVAKSPNEKKNATYFGAQGSNDASSFLPLGFLERTKNVGMVVTSWAPQVRILSHGSTGGFVTHCGWNSTLESIVNGVPLIAWPLYAEQKSNAVLLEEEMKVAWRVKVNDKGIVERDEICKCAKRLIEEEEGEVIRKRMMELKEASRLALSDDGSSTRSLDEVANVWKEHKK